MVGRLVRPEQLSEVARAVARLGDPEDVVTVVTVGTSDLSTARWSHRIVDGRASTRVWLKNGTVIDTEAVGAVLNRMAAVPTTGFTSSTASDGAYADSEQQALFVSFLRSCGARVINNVDGHGPLGLWSPLRWAALAHRCGIETWPDGIGAGTRLPSRRASRPAAPAATWQVTVVGQRVFGAVSSMQEDSAVFAWPRSRSASCRSHVLRRGWRVAAPGRRSAPALVRRDQRSRRSPAVRSGDGFE